MKYIDLKSKLRDYIVFSTEDIKKNDPDFYNQRLSEWQKKGYIKKIVKQYYFFSDREINDSVLFIFANKILEPSYISMEMALSYHGLIPESVYNVTSVSSKKTYSFNSQSIRFSYRKIKPKLMFGYQLVSYKKYVFKMAEMEKAFLDYFYFYPDIKNDNEFRELRINREVFLAKLNVERLNRYLIQFKNKSLEKRIENFIKFIQNA